jgi:hypothetical protein
LIFILFDKFGEDGLHQYYKTLYVLIYRLRLEYMQVRYNKVAQYPKDLFASIEKAKDLNLNMLNKKALEKIDCRKDVSEIQQAFIDYGVTINK